MVFDRKKHQQRRINKNLHGVQARIYHIRFVDLRLLMITFFLWKTLSRYACSSIRLFNERIHSGCHHFYNRRCK